jgi:hypothetical protein
MLALFRLLGVWLLLLAMVATVIDATKSLASGGTWIVTPMIEQWRDLSPLTLEAAKQSVETNVGPVLWDPIITSILTAPTWIIFGVLGFGLYWLGRKRRPVEVFIN